MTDKEYLKQMGARIQAARKKRKLYVRDLGQLCDIDYSCLSRIENGQYSSQILTLRKIAAALEMDVKDFL